MPDWQMLRRLLARDRAINGTSRQGTFGFVEALVFSPGFSLMLQYRLAHHFYRRGRAGRILGLLIWRRSIRSSNCYLSPRATIGPGLHLPHPTGMVIGEGVRIGADVTIFQNVTLGTRGTGSIAYPSVEDQVTIYPGAVVVGPVTIGRGARVGANAFVARDVPAGATVAGVPAKPVGASASRTTGSPKA
jgi:serine O-acetyltransferase